MSPPKYQVKHLGKQSERAVDEFDLIPWKHGSITVSFECTEFTSLCPVTKQPDYAMLVIEYVPNKHIVETKSLKLYLQRFRDTAEFNEVLVATIAKAFYDQVKPHVVTVTGRFHHRGGISPTAVVTHGDHP